MINKTSAISPNTKQNVSFGHNLKEAHKLIAQRLMNPKAEHDYLVKLGRKIQAELPEWNIFANAKPTGINFDAPEAKYVWENRFVAHEFIGGHLNSIDNTARSFLSNTSLAKQNVKDLSDWGITVRKKSDEVLVDYSEEFVNKYLGACAKVVKENINTGLLVEHFGDFMK